MLFKFPPEFHFETSLVLLLAHKPLSNPRGAGQGGQGPPGPPWGCGLPRPAPARSARRGNSGTPPAAAVPSGSPSPAPRIPPSLQHGRGAAGLGGAFPSPFRQSRLLLQQPRKFVPAAQEVQPPPGWRFLCSFFPPFLSLSLPYPLPPSTNCPISVTFLRFFLPTLFPGPGPARRHHLPGRAGQSRPRPRRIAAGPGTAPARDPVGSGYPRT